MKRYITKAPCKAFCIIQSPKILNECEMQIKVHDGYIKCLKIVNSFSLNDSRKISLKWRHLPQCILDVKAEIEEKEIPFELLSKWLVKGCQLYYITTFHIAK